MSTATVHHQCHAMATRFELILCGNDVEHLDAVAAVCIEGIQRVEHLLSRFDPAGEIARLNCCAGSDPVRVDVELFSILCNCFDWWQRTGGYFDVTASGRTAAPHGGMGDVLLSAEERSVRFARADLRLDLGGYGKGYALDRAGDILRRYGVHSALLHGGTSSILVLGRPPDRDAWRIGVRDPSDADSELLQLDLSDCGFSSSFVHDEPGDVSDIIVPHSAAPLSAQAGCFVEARDALTAEILSTALLAMGKAGAINYIRSCAMPGTRIGWIECHDDESCWEWLNDPPRPLNPPSSVGDAS